MKTNTLRKDIDFYMFQAIRFCRHKEKVENEEKRKKFLKYLFFKKQQEKEELDINCYGE